MNQKMSQSQYIKTMKSAVQNSPHPGPPSMDMFQPTSVIALFVFNEETELLFIQKADVKGYAWANQMAFPGGHKDDEDISTKATALRELHEEMGIESQNVEIIGSLGHFQTINSKDIEAWVGAWNKKDTINFDTAEIARVFQIPLKHLIKTHKENGYHGHTPNMMQLTYPYEDILVWGVTAKILHHFLEILLNNETLRIGS